MTSFGYRLNPTYVDESPNVFNPPPQPSVYPCEFCGNDAYYGHYCTPQAPFIYPEQCYNQDFNFPQDFQDVPQQYPCCDDCGVTHDAYQCQPMNEVYDYGQNSCYDSTSIGFNQSQPQQYTVKHPIFNAHNDPLISQTTLNEQMTQLTSMCELFCQFVQKKQEEKQIEEEQAAKAQYWKPINTIEVFSESNEEFSSTDDDSFSFDKIDYVEASPPDSELVSSGVMEIVIPEVGGIKASNDNPIPSHDSIISGNPPNLTPSGESEFFSEVDAFLAVDDESTSSQFPKSDLDKEGDMLLFESFLNDDPSSESQTKSSSTFLNSLLEETNNFHNSLPECTTFSHVLCDAECESATRNKQSQ
nr:hypothetical protein [Tanacetum cinerariifolium]